MTRDELIGEYREINIHHDWWDLVYDNFVERLKEAGLRVDTRNIEFSGFWSQGDGAKFALGTHSVLRLTVAAQKWMLEEWPKYQGKGEDGANTGGPIIDAIHDYCETLLKQFEVGLLDGALREEMDDASINVCCGGYYQHSGHMVLNLDYGNGDRVFAMHPDEDLLTDALRGLADALYVVLREEYEYQTNDAQVWEAIEANGLDEELNDEEEDESCSA